jgi:hypothetical protein
MGDGGDGYLRLTGRYTSDGRLMAEVVAAYLRAQGTVSPAIQGRITCTGTGCPTVTP